MTSILEAVSPTARKHGKISGSGICKILHRRKLDLRPPSPKYARHIGPDGRFNRGRNSQTKSMQIKIQSQGVIWAHHHRRPVPPKTTVIHSDGNKNNLDPKNLILRTIADAARANSIQYQLARDPEAIGQILKRPGPDFARSLDTPMGAWTKIQRLAFITLKDRLTPK